MSMEHEAVSVQALRLYRDLADWYPLLTPVGDYAEEAAFYRRLFETHFRRRPRTLLDLGSGGNGRGLRYLEWRWIPDSTTDRYVTDMAYLLRDVDGTARVNRDRHVMGLFPRAVWLESISTTGFEPLSVPFAHSSYSDTGHDVVVGLLPVAGGAA